MSKLALWVGYGLIFILSVSPAMADGNLNWHGFVAQGVTQSDGSDYITDNDDITAELTEVGLNAIYTINPALSVAGQVVYLDGGNRFRQGARVDYLFLDWRMSQLFDWQVNVHLGRFKNRHWLYSATQDVPQTRPSITLPQSIYFDGNRDVALSSDGVAIQSTKVSDSGTWDVRWSLGRSPIAKEDTKRLLSGEVSGRVKQDYVHQFSIYWQPESMQWQIGFSLLQSDFTYQPAEQDILLKGASGIDRITLAARYDTENWELTSELLRDRLSYNGDFIGGISLDVDKTGEGGYVQWRYFLNDSLTAMLRFDSYDLDRKDRNGSELAANPFGAIPAHYGFMDTFTAGLSWNISDKLRVSGEFARTHGAARLSVVMFPEALVRAEPYWNAWSIQMMYWF